LSLRAMNTNARPVIGPALALAGYVSRNVCACVAAGARRQASTMAARAGV
jgi:hypothetical protein